MLKREYEPLVGGTNDTKRTNEMNDGSCTVTDEEFLKACHEFHTHGCDPLVYTLKGKGAPVYSVSDSRFRLDPDYTFASMYAPNDRVTRWTWALRAEKAREVRKESVLDQFYEGVATEDIVLPGIEGDDQSPSVIVDTIIREHCKHLKRELIRRGH